MVAVLDELELTALVTSITGLSAGRAPRRSWPRPATCGGSPPRRAVVKHAGLAPRERMSGAFTGRTRLTGQGRPGLRVAAWRAVWGAQRANPVYAGPLPAPDHQGAEQAHAHPGPDRRRRRDPAPPVRGHHHRAGVGSGRRNARHPPPGRCASPPHLAERSVTAGGRGEPSAALRHPGDLVAHHGSPVRRLLNPITRCPGSTARLPLCRDQTPVSGGSVQGSVRSRWHD